MKAVIRTILNEWKERKLLKASKELKCRNLLIITEGKEGEEEIKGRMVRYRPLWKWLLEKSGKTQL